MNVLQNAFHVTPSRKQFLIFLLSAVLVTSSHVSIAQAADALPDKSALVIQASAVETAKNVAEIVRSRVPLLPGPRLFPQEVAEELPIVEQKPVAKTSSLRMKIVEAAAEDSVRTLVVPTTAYTSDPRETDATPFITADGTHVRDGIVAANFLPLGTRIRIPDYFGDKVFEVHDRMNVRYWQRVDIWMTSKSAAFNWGVRRVKIEILP